MMEVLSLTMKWTPTPKREIAPECGGSDPMHFTLHRVGLSGFVADLLAEKTPCK